MEIARVLENAILNPDPAKRSEAEHQLEEAAASNFVGYLGLLTQALADSNQKTEVRMLAGIALKNQLLAKDATKKQEMAQRWIAIDRSAKAQIKETALQSLLSEDDRVANSAAQLIAAIADIELPREEWPELMHIIVENTKAGQPVHVKRASLVTIGYICESADPTNAGVAAQANGILIAIVQGAQSSEPSPVVRLAAIKALVDSLEFIGNNFQREGERNYIMQVVCEATQADDSELQASAFGALAKIMSLYYPYMSVYMEKALYGLTVSGMQSSDEKVACMAVEFWSTVCEEELEIAAQQEYDPASAEELTCYNFALVAIQDVLPTLLTLLTRQNEDPEDDDWSVAMAAGACLQLFAQNTENYVVQPTLQFVEQNLAEQDWRKREAAVMAFGSILDGPDKEQLRSLIAQALTPILSLMKDDTLQVKETVAWCLGRIADLVIDAIDINTALPQVIQAILQGLQDHPKVSTNCCWTLINLVEQLCGSQQEPLETTAMSQYFPILAPALVTVSAREDNEYFAKTSAYEALSSMVLYAPQDVMAFVNEIASVVMERLGKTIDMQAALSTTEAKTNLQEEQANILSLLSNIIRRVGSNVVGAADGLMEKLLRLLSSQEPNSIIEEDIFIAISAIAAQIDRSFDKYMPAFLPFLSKALENTDSPVCDAAIGLVVDISHSLSEDINKYCQSLMASLGNILSKPTIRRELRPLVLSALGDIASSIGADFIQYLEVVMSICAQAQGIQPEDMSIETEDYVFQVKESVLDTYVGIISGLTSYPQAVQPYVAQIFGFLMTVYQDPQMSASDSVCKSAVGLIGDLATMYPAGEIKEIYSQDWIADFIKKTKQNPAFSQTTKDTARWAREQQRKQLTL